jgi:ABC-type bacteriocin/lantibiotic exporter with double-glycine peptidase domain
MEIRLCIIAFSFVALFACASAPQAVYHGDVIIGNVPFYSQEDHQCGPASLSGVLNYQGLGISPEEIARDLFSKSAGGTLTLDMALYPKRKGFSSLSYSGSVRDLREKIDSGYPLIVMVDYGFSVWQVNHFMVVVGYNNDGVIVNSGKKEHEFIENDTFLRNWRKTDFWALLVKKK